MLKSWQDGSKSARLIPAQNRRKRGDISFSIDVLGLLPGICMIFLTFSAVPAFVPESGQSSGRGRH